MTVIIAQNNKDNIIIASDSGLYRGYSKIHGGENHQKLSKNKQVNGITIASTGYKADSLNFDVFVETRKPESNSLLSMQRYFVDFRKWLSDQSLEFKGTNFFLCYKNKLYHYMEEAVYEILENEYQCDGAGSVEAYTAMYLGKTPKQAVKIASELNIYVSGEVIEFKIDK